MLREVSLLQEALSICQRNLENLDMSVNAKKTCCLRIGPRANVSCARIQTLSIGYNIVWSGLCECNEHDPLQTCCNILISL